MRIVASSAPTFGMVHAPVSAPQQVGRTLDAVPGGDSDRGGDAFGQCLGKTPGESVSPEFVGPRGEQSELVAADSGHKVSASARHSPPGASG